MPLQPILTKVKLALCFTYRFVTIEFIRRKRQTAEMSEVA